MIPTSATAITHPMESNTTGDADAADAVETLATHVVLCMERFIDVLREEYAPKPGAVASAQTASCTKAELLYRRVVEHGLPADVQMILQQRKVTLPGFDDDGVGRVEDCPQKGTDAGSIQQLHLPQIDEVRRSVFPDIVLPLLQTLTGCYQVLDQLPEPSVPDPDPSAGIRLRSDRAKKPAPPRGMLSLRNYTDVACLLEFLVCGTILPHLEPHILATIQDRLRHQLPRTLAGRIPKACLLLWCETVDLATAGGDGCDTSAVLYESAVTIANLVLLDRFRPMLLPRHLPDIYAALFQAEHLQQTRQQRQKQSQQQAQGAGYDVHADDASLAQRQPQKAALYLVLGLYPSDSDDPASVGPTLQAKAYQTLLVNGVSSPLWLRRRVSPLLTELASRHLAAILAVFVPLQSHQQQAELSSSCRRLARTLLASSTSPSASTTEPLQHQLCRQLLGLLTVAFPVGDGGTIQGSGTDVTLTVGDARISPRSMAVIQTAWAVLDLVPTSVVESSVIQVWVRGLTATPTESRASPSEGGSRGIHATVRQIGALCAFVPPSIARRDGNDRRDPSLPFVLHRLLESGILSQLARVACMLPSLVVAASTTTITARARQDAQQTFRWICQAAYTAERDGENAGEGTVVEAFVAALAPSNWDLAGNQYRSRELSSTETSSGNGNTSTSLFLQLEDVEIYQESNSQQSSSSVNLPDIVERMTQRAQFFVDQIVSVLAPPPPPAPDAGEGGLQKGMGNGARGLPSHVFRMLLRTYLSRSVGTQVERSLTPEVHRGRLQLVAAALLPILCEKCSQEQLLFGEEDHGVGLMILMREILSHALSTTIDATSDTRSVGMKHSEETSSEEKSLDDFLALDGETLEQTMSSLTSIVMSMLIAVLELGSQTRSKEEEDILQSFLPIMEELASQQSGNQRLPADEGAAMADMASYGAALIASRRALSSHDGANSTSTTIPPSRGQKLRVVLEEAEKDIASSQPAIRARGMVSLGRLARGFAGALPNEKSPPIIQELNESGEVVENDEMTALILEILRLAIVALSDKESYVYLAAVQTIVALGDLHPKEVLAVVATYVVDGRISEPPSLSVREMSQEQRIKLAEALMFIIRRRAVVDEFVPSIVHLMTYGSGASDQISGPAETVHEQVIVRDGDNLNDLIQQQTHKYFTDGDEEEQDNDERGERHGTSLKEKWEAQDVRVRTGGPVFATEESDVLRSVRISVLAELVSASFPAAMSAYCSVLVRLAVDALRLDPSRAVSRAAALLSRELYSCLLREAHGLAAAISEAAVGRGTDDVAPIPFAVAMLYSNEEGTLLATLRQQAAESRGADVAAGRSRPTDPTTTVRCQEAISLRCQAEESGIFLAAQLVRAEQIKLQELPGMLTVTPSETKRGKASRLLRLDPLETLE